MDQNTVLSKSAKGKEEIDTRKYKLDQRLRSVLITVNGKLTVEALAKQFASMADIHTALEKLWREGFVQEQVDDTVRLKPARSELAAFVSAALGPGGDDIAMKIEAAKSMADLRAYLESHRATLDSALGKEKSAAFWAKANGFTA
jgi:hypothetical protein